LQTLQTNGLVEPSEGSVGGYVFLVVEELKKRFRLVHDTIVPNVMLPEPFNPHFVPIHVLQERVAGATWAVTVDFKAFYYQFPLADEVKPFFSFQTGSSNFRMCRLPMGFKWAVVIAQSMATHVMAMVREGCVLQAFDVYIDNILMVGSKDQCAPALQKLLGVCADVGISVGAVSDGPQVVHRGVLFDFTTQQVSLSPDFVSKFRRRAAHNKGSWGEWRSQIGSAVYAMLVLKIPLGHIYYVLKFWARHTFTAPKQEIRMWTHACTQFLCVLASLDTKVMLQKNPELQAYLFTDATPTQLGAVLVVREKLFFWAEKLQHTTNIAEAEALACWRSCQGWTQHVAQLSLSVVIDNISVLCALNKGFSPNFFLNRTVCQVLELWKANHTHPTLFYIRSKENPADALSRGQPLSSRDLSLLSSVSSRPPVWVVQRKRMFENVPIFVWRMAHELEEGDM
jgi:hypothetical protein